MNQISAPGARKVGVSQDIANNLGLMVIAALLLFNGGCLIALSFYGITREKHEANLRELARKRAEIEEAQAPAE